MNTLRGPNFQRPVWRAAFGALATLATLAACGGSSKSTEGSHTSSTPASFTDSIDVQSASVAKPGRAVLLQGSQHDEIQQFGADTFADYEHATGYGPRLAKGMHVVVDCLAIGPVEAAPSAKGLWYHMEAPIEFAGYFAAANTFENGDTTGPLSEQPMTDPAVPRCP